MDHASSTRALSRIVGHHGWGYFNKEHLSCPSECKFNSLMESPDRGNIHNRNSTELCALGLQAKWSTQVEEKCNSERCAIWPRLWQHGPGRPRQRGGLQCLLGMVPHPGAWRRVQAPKAWILQWLRWLHAVQFVVTTQTTHHHPPSLQQLCCSRLTNKKSILH